MNRTYLDKKGLDKVADKVNTKLTMSDTIPAASSELKGKRILYTGEASSGYIPGKIYTCVEYDYGGGYVVYGWTDDPYTYGIMGIDGKFYGPDGKEIIGDLSDNLTDSRFEDCSKISKDVYTMRFSKFVPFGSYVMDRDLTTFIDPDNILTFPEAADTVALDGKPIRYRHTGPTTDDLVYGYFYELKRLVAEPVGTENPKALDWLELAENSGYSYHIVSTDTTVNPSKTYYYLKWVRMDTQPSINLDNYLPAWEGTSDEWEALTDDEKAKYIVLHFTDDEDDEEDDVIYELDPRSNKPVASSGLFKVLPYYYMWTAFAPYNTSTYNKRANIYPVMSGDCAIISINGAIPNSNYVKSEISVNNDTVKRTVPSNLESDAIFKSSIIVFVNNTSSETVPIDYIVYGNASGYGTDESIVYLAVSNMPQSMMRQLIDIYKAQDQAGLAIYLEVT